MNRDECFVTFDLDRLSWITEDIERDLKHLKEIWEAQTKIKPERRAYQNLEKLARKYIDRITQKGEQNTGYDPMWLIHFRDDFYQEH